MGRTHMQKNEKIKHFVSLVQCQMDFSIFYIIRQ